MHTRLLSILLFAIISMAQAQDYPVTASTQLIPPYSPYLPDYTTTGNDKLRVILLQRDLTQPSYDITLQMTLEHNGTIIMRTAPYYHPQPITLTAGVPIVISGTSLSNYFHPDNLLFAGGYSRATYETTHSLPEGSYRLTFTAFDYRRPSLQVSTSIPSIFFLQKSNPPLLNLPICGSRIEKRDPQFLTFNWTNLNTSHQNTSYIFSLYEIKPSGSNADYIIRSTRPIYTLSTDNTSILYGPGEPLLTDSMQYAWMVQAIDKDGKDLYSNQGYSQSCTFTYQGTNPFANSANPILSGSAQSERQIHYHWPAADSLTTTYRLQYRAASFDWQTVTINKDTSYILNSLEPNRTYEARLQWQQSGVYSNFSDLVTITTPPLPIINCGTASQPSLPVNNELQPTLIAGNILRIGLFDVILTTVTGSNGLFSGKGRVITPGFGFGLLVAFDKVTVNTDLAVLKGEMQALTNGIDNFIETELSAQHGGDDVGNVKTGDLVADITTYLHLFSETSIVVDVSSHTITLTDSQDGTKVTLPFTKLPLILEDADGNIYHIDEKGNVSFAGKRNTAIAINADLQLDAGRVDFTPAADNQYAFDTGTVVSLANGQYSMHAKAIIPGAQETVIAHVSIADNSITDTSIITHSSTPHSSDTAIIQFISGKGIILPSTCKGNTCKVTITGGPGGDAQEIHAITQNGKTIGKLLVPSYTPQQKKIIFIPIGATTTIPENTIITALQTTYGRIGITYTLETDNSFRHNKTWDLNQDSVLQDSKSAFLSNGFTGEERAMKKAYTQSHTINPEAIYLFVINEAAMAGADLIGKMPRQSQFGFIFLQHATGNEIARAVAHEVGHGNYTLEHIRGTNNLMGDGNGLALIKSQWDIVHDPGNVWGLFEDDAASELTKGLSLYKCLQKEVQDACTQPLFYAPDSSVVQLPNAATPLSIFYQDFSNSYPAMAGSLNSFSFNGKEYTAVYYVNTGKFKGYSYDKYDTAAYIYSHPKKDNDHINIFEPDKEVYTCNIKVNGVAYNNDGCLCQDNLYTRQYKRLMREVIGSDQPAIEAEIASICKTIITLPGDVLSTNNELFNCYYNNPELYYIDWNNAEAVLTFEQLQRMHRQLKTLDSSITLLKNCSFSSGKELVAFINTHFVISGSKTSYLTGAQFKELTPATRACLITLLLKDSYEQRWTVSSSEFGGQNIMLEILRSCKGAAELNEVLHILQQQHLLYTLFADTYDYLYLSRGSFMGLCTAVTAAWLNGSKPATDYSLIQQLISDKHWLVFDNGVLTASNREAFNDDTQQLKFQVSNGVSTYLKFLLAQVSAGGAALFADYGTATPFEGSFDPMAYLLIIPKRDIQAFGTTFEKGIPYILPAISVYALFKMDTKKAIEISTELLLNTAFCAVGMEGLSAAGGVNTAIELLNITLPNFVTYVNAAPEMVQDHPEIVKYTNYLSLAYIVGTLTAGSVKAIRNARINVPAEMMLDRYAADAEEIGMRRVLLQEQEIGMVKEWLKGIGDERAYVAIYGNGSEYIVNYNGVEIILDHYSLARCLEKVNIPANKEIVLLSCGDLSTGQHLSTLLERPVIANNGWVVVYENGVIDGERGFVRLLPDGTGAAKVKVGKEGNPVGRSVRLGKTRCASYDNVRMKILKMGDKTWQMKFKLEDVEMLVERGMESGVTLGELEDIVLNGCRPDKSYDASNLVDQLDFWSVVKKRGYPNLFNSVEEFKEFGSILKGLAREWGLPEEEIYVQGSALEIKNPSNVDDLDVAIRVGAEEFEKLLIRFESMLETPNMLNEIGQNDKIGGFIMFKSKEKGAVSFTKEFYSNYINHYGTSFTQKYNHNLQISIIKETGKLDISPYLKLK